MKPLTHKTVLVALLLASTLFNACKKSEPTVTPVTNTTPQTYGSLAAFYSQNQAPLQEYTINAGTGGSFTTQQGTVVKIPANVFVNSSGGTITGTVTVAFQDIYKKSDMLMSGYTPMLYYGQAMNSGGEFYIIAKSGDSIVNLNGITPITITQPLNGWPSDKNMSPFIKAQAGLGTSVLPKTWIFSSDSTACAVNVNPTNYVFSLYTFNTPVDSGSWCNSDNSKYFNAYTQTNFTIQTTDTTFPEFTTDVFLLFNGVNSMVHVYENYGEPQGKFPYSYAPLGLNCTVVAVAVDSKGNLNSAFVPNTTITANGTVNFTLTPTTVAAFKTQLAIYNH
ncbi:MAG TPA: hypothetical protein VK783_08650 [Bacteroidia bacterium]|jgi:hypothetical protein|nr:hypothetical protein [Bacteroidia bacterium]